MSGRLIARDRAALVVVDVQDGFRSYDTFADVARQCGRLVKGAGILGVPVVATEQYPKGLQRTAPEVGLPEDAARVEKSVFSAVRAEGFDLAGRDQVLICGIEAHVCVAQTALDLLDQGVAVQVVTDAVGSRHANDREVGLHRLDRAGAVLTTVEAVLLELCERAGTPEFKAVQKVIL
ncbi:MAG TPA: isochorismatase family protein [Baekduia sp.]|uniref:isochorismatase family protein n=1 Tax=Baekduia sp. TaxID=2600305 RepID=UPI002C378DB3|nr:isochorismatase family protein [Baekduia sp.]HMJ37448.1 isochorismatase family protein [Baekduia sp.]